jgi:leucyl aminopeptidase
MTHPVAIHFRETDLGALDARTGRIALVVAPEGKLSPAGRKLDRLMRGALARAIASEPFGKLK